MKRRFVLPQIMIALSALSIGRSAQASIIVPHTEVSYTYPLDFGPAGPNQGDSAQPRSDVRFYGDPSGDLLSNGVTATFFPGDLDPDIYIVGFNEYHGSGAGTDTGTPQPRIDFDLGGPRDLEATSVNYFAGGHSAILGPERVEIRLSFDGGLNYSDSPDVVYSGFDRTNDPSPQTLFATTDFIGVNATGVTNLRMDFYQGNWSQRPNTSAWVFLGEVSFFEVVPEPSSLGIWGILAVGLLTLHRRRSRLRACRIESPVRARCNRVADSPENDTDN